MSKDIINKAIKNKQVINFYYNNKPRTVEPYAIGKTSENKINLLSIQIGGVTSSGKLPDWRMFELNKIKNITIHKRKFAAYFKAYQDEERQSFHPAYKVLSLTSDLSEELLIQLCNNYNARARYIENKPYWQAQDLVKLLGYSRLDSFRKVVNKANSVSGSADSFGDQLNYNLIENFRIQLFDAAACLSIAKSANQKKQEVAFAKVYFAVEFAKESIDAPEQVEGLERIKARMQLSETERYLSSVMHSHGAKERDLGRIRSIGDNKLFGGLNTASLKDRLGAKRNQSLADFLPSILIKAKEFAGALTCYDVNLLNISDPFEISKNHSSNNALIRRILAQKNIVPENILFTKTS